MRAMDTPSEDRRHHTAGKTALRWHTNAPSTQLTRQVDIKEVAGRTHGPRQGT